MAELFNKNTYTGKFWDVAVAIHRTNAAPLDSTEIFTSYADALAYAKTGTTAYYGQCITVAEIDGDTIKSVKPYIIDVEDVDGSQEGTLKPIVTGSIDISGKVVNIYYDVDTLQYYDNDLDPEHLHPLVDISGLKPIAGLKQYLRLSIGDDDVYVATEDLISLENYYTKPEVDEKINNLNSSIGLKLDVINNDIEGILDYLDIIDSSITSMKDIEEGLQNQINDINSSINGIEERVDTIENTLQNGVVSSVKASTSSNYIKVAPMDSSRGDVTISIDASIVNNYDDQKSIDEQNGLATSQYIEDRLEWIQLGID